MTVIAERRRTRVTRKWSKGTHSWLVRIGAIILGILLWQALVWVFEPAPYVLPRPLAVWHSLSDGTLTGWSDTSGYWYHLRASLGAALLAFSIGAVVGGLAGAAVAESRTIRLALEPYIIGFQSMPKVALAPLIVIWFGFGVSAKVAFAAILCFFPVFINTYQGLMESSGSQVELMRSLRASRWQTFRHVKLRGSLPYIFAGFDMAMVYGLLGVIVSEFLGAQNGMGVVINQARSVNDTATVFAVLLILSISGFALHIAVKAIEGRVVFWSDRQSVDSKGK